MKESYNRNRKSILIVAALVLVGFLVYRSAKSPKENPLTPATISFESSSETVTSDTQIKIKADTKENKVGFIQVKVTFDPSKLSLKENPVPDPAFKTVIKSTSADEANTSGVIYLAIGLEPGKQGQSGVFGVGTLQFGTKAPNEAVTLTFDTSESQVVTMEAKPLPLEKIDFTISTK